MKTIISNNPPKGTADWLPQEFAIRKYIFDIWRSVCTSFGYNEYLTPIIESAEVYRAKSGEDVGGKELMTMTDLAGRELAIRPEMTPSVTRMVTKIYNDTPKPIRLFSIANFLRNEKPQRGRNREFWQLNFDIFGSQSLQADVEILQIALEIMLKFKATKENFVMYINNRKLIDFILNDIIQIKSSIRTEIIRIIDKWSKLSEEEIEDRFKEIDINKTQIELLKKFMLSENLEDLKKNLPKVLESEGLTEITNTLNSLNELGYTEFIEFRPSIIRGFDYYDGMVFEVFDKHPQNSRAMFGGGRYNGLASIFGKESFPAVGCAPGDETTKLFLKSWNLIPSNLTNSVTYIPILENVSLKNLNKIATDLRRKNENVELGLEVQKISKALEYANRIGFKEVVIFGENEEKKGAFLVKNMSTGETKEYGL